VEIVFVHGAGESAAVWQGQLDGLAKTRAIDLPGHGEQPGEGLPSVAAYADFVSEQISNGPVIVAGHSMGGAIALEIGLRRPDWLAGMVIVASGARLRVHPDILNALDGDWDAAIDQLCDWAIGPFADTGVRQATEAALRRSGQAVTRGDYLGVNEFDVMDRLDEIEVPALAVAGDRDIMTPPRYAHFIAGRIPVAGTAIVPGAGHMVMLEQPAATNDIFSAFRRHFG